MHHGAAKCCWSSVEGIQQNVWPVINLYSCVHSKAGAAIHTGVKVEPKSAELVTACVRENVKEFPAVTFQPATTLMCWQHYAHIQYARVPWCLQYLFEAQL